MNSAFSDNVLMASDFHTLLPRHRRPESTAGRRGFILVDSITTQGDRTEVKGILRAFSDEETQDLVNEVTRAFNTVKGMNYKGTGFSLTFTDQYKNMKTLLPRQVVALADVYDALTSERVYKKAYSHEEAVQMICNGECGTFNPLLLECLCEIQDHIKKELQEAAYRSEMSDPERKNKKFEHYDNSQKKFFGAVTRAIEKEYGTAGEELSRMKTEEEK